MMNRYGRSSYVGGASSSSKASANTICQKCLKKGHYSFECKAQAQERPYISRPSRSQQFLNPKLKPKLTNVAPEPSEQEYAYRTPHTLNSPLTSARKSLARREPERPRKRSLEDMDRDRPSRNRTRSRSVSSYSSISTISTRSPSPDRSRRIPSSDRYPTSHKGSLDGSTKAPARDKRRRRSSSASSSDHMSSYDTQHRNTRMRRNSRSPSQRGRRRSRSAMSERRMRSASVNNDNRNGRGLTDKPRRADPDDRPRLGTRVDRDRPEYHHSRGDTDREMRDVVAGAESRPRSLSPFSKRLALTQAINNR